jgi:hypothetical protein
VRSGIWQPRFWQPEMRQGRAFSYEGALPIFLPLALEMGGGAAAAAERGGGGGGGALVGFAAF